MKIGPALKEVERQNLEIWLKYDTWSLHFGLYIYQILLSIHFQNHRIGRSSTIPISLASGDLCRETS